MALLAGSCGSGGGSSSSDTSGATSRIAIDITDAPFDHSLVKSAEIVIWDIKMHVQADAESGFINTFTGPLRFDLMRLRNGISRRIESEPLPEGEYRQIRLYLQSANIVLNDGREFSTEDGSLKMPSSAESGLKFFLDPPVQLVEGGLGRVLLDFDLTKSFKPVPANNVEHARSFILSPVVRAVTDPSNSLRGVVMTDDGSGNSIPVELAVVYVLEDGETDLDQAIATTATEADGSLAVLGLDEGTYDLVVVKDGVETRVEDVFVAGSGPTNVDITL